MNTWVPLRPTVSDQGFAHMVTKLSAADLANDLLEILDRVRGRGEQFAIERDGETVAVLAPPPPRIGITWDEFIARVGDLEMPGDGFADDLEEIQASQGIATSPEWPD